MTTLWQASSRCDTAARIGDHMALRNSHRPDLVVFFTEQEWKDFIADAKAGEYDQR